MKIKKNLKIRNIAGESVVIMQGKNLSDMTKVISLNPTSLYLWDTLFGKEFGCEDVVKALLDKYEVEESRAREDACKWIESLTNCGVII